MQQSWHASKVGLVAHAAALADVDCCIAGLKAFVLLESRHPLLIPFLAVAQAVRCHLFFCHLFELHDAKP